jgi:hypothetical protein
MWHVPGEFDSGADQRGRERIGEENEDVASYHVASGSGVRRRPVAVLGTREQA